MQTIHNTAFICVWRNFKLKFDTVTETEMQLKLLFFEILNKLEDYSEHLNDYQMKYFNDNRIEIPENILQCNDLKEGEDFKLIMDPNLFNEYIRSDEYKEKHLPIVTGPYKMPTGIDKLFVMGPEFKEYLLSFLQHDDDIELTDDEIIKRMWAYVEIHKQLPEYILQPGRQLRGKRLEPGAWADSPSSISSLDISLSQRSMGLPSFTGSSPSMTSTPRSSLSQTPVRDHSVVRKDIKSAKSTGKRKKRDVSSLKRMMDRLKSSKPRQRRLSKDLKSVRDEYVRNLRDRGSSASQQTSASDSSQF